MPKAKEFLKRINLRITDVQQKFLKTYSRENNLGESEFLRMLIQEKMDKVNKKKK